MMSARNNRSGNFSVGNITGENNNIINANAQVPGKFTCLFFRINQDF